MEVSSFIQDPYQWQVALHIQWYSGISVRPSRGRQWQESNPAPPRARVVKLLEVEDASSTSAALKMLQRWMGRIAGKETKRLTAKCQRYQDQGKTIPSWVRRGMDERFRRLEQVEQRIQMLLGIFASHGVLSLEFKPAHSVGDLLLQLLAEHFTKVYKVSLPLAA
jgi:hypothetical protein